MAKRKRARQYVLFGCPIDLKQRYEVNGYVGKLADGRVGLISNKADAFVYVDNKKSGHGSPDDWAKLFKEDYGLNVHPVFLTS